ncbi:uncharacterized protein DUF1524 [Motilibacter rhizosphaerae]|uniref:Uncharacterized protein DUF1524 n=1 Tax=Motilibacter rhizosphaerae TaxID=598652 RepID=A0A4Q7NSG6_9ACTN|nr:HNH endonuclease family protein [Motilibacter rhizosphaerae]RZS90073.1 uncharacterized protein DUF1524 [Motilibacter rhizosphaerae]
MLLDHPAARRLHVLLLLCLAVLLSGCWSSTPASSGSPGAAGSAVDALQRLPVASRVATGYRRAAFGDGWLDLDGDGCSTRQEVLRRDLTGVRLSGLCTVDSGRLADPYTGRVVVFQRGPRTSADVQVDHVVALADAWRTGAAGWSAARRERFANDPLELLAVDGEVNQDKGDGDAAQWLPPLPSARCAYVARQVAVKTAYGLAVRPSERSAMLRVLGTCPGQRLPSARSSAVR